MPLIRTSRKTLTFYTITSFPRRNPSNFKYLHSSRDESSEDEFFIKFSEIVKRFSKRTPDFSPKIGARPRHPHPFEYNALMKQFSLNGDVDQVLRLFREMKYFRCKPDLACYTTVIDSLVISSRPREAIAVFDEMISFRFAPDAACFTVLVKLFSCYLKQFDLAYEVIRWMVKSRCYPDVITYSTLISGLCFDGRVEEALGVLDQMLEEQCLPNVYTYTPIVQAYCSIGRIEEAKRLIDSMERFGCTPNTVTYNVLIEALCKIGAFGEVEKVLEERNVKGWKADAITHSIYMDGLCKWGKFHQSFEQLDVMIGNGLKPNSVTLNILLDCLCRGSKVSEAKCLLERSSQLEWDVDVVNYNTVMSKLCDVGRWLAVLKLFTDMLKKGIAANSWTFSIVIHSLCKAGKLHKAKCMFNSKGFVANVVTYTTLIRHFYAAGAIGEVHFLFAKMGMEKVSPNPITYCIIIDCLCQEGNFLGAIECFYKSLDNGFSSQIVARLTNWLVRGGKIGTTLILFEQLRGWGLNIDVIIFRSLVKAFCGMGYCQRREIYQVCHVLDKMLGTR